LWLAPLVLHRDSATLRDHPDWAVRGRDGAIRYHDSWLGSVAALDCTQPDARAWLTRVIETVAHDWGYRYLKFDALSYAAQPDGLYHAPNTTAAANLRAGLEVVRAAAGDDVYLLACTCPFGPAVGVVDAMRVGADVEARWYDPAQLPSAFNALRLTLPRWFMHRRWWSNDPDCLLARTTNSSLTRNERRTLATGIAISGGNVVLGDDLRELEAGDIALLRALLPPLGVALRPRDLLTHETPRLFAAAEDDGALVALFNWQDAALTFGATAAELGLPAGRYHVFEFWEQLYLGVLDGVLPERIAAHDCRLYRLTPDGDTPRTVGAGTTIALRSVLVSEHWDAAEATLTLTLAADATAPDTIIVAVPGALREAAMEVSGAVALERAGAVLRLAVDPRAARQIALRFVR
jgi:alpha-galactosidase